MKENLLEEKVETLFETLEKTLRFNVLLLRMNLFI